MGASGDLIAAALQHLQAGQTEQAAHLYRQVLEHEPKHPDANQNLGVLLVQRGQVAAALQHFAVSVRERPGDEAHWLAYCQCLLDNGRAAEALEAIEEAQRSGHSGPRLTRLRETIVLSLNEAAARRAIIASPDSGAGWKMLGLILQVRKQYPEALLMLEKAGGMLPQDVEISVALGYAYEMTGQLQAAAACFDRGITLSPDSYLAHRGKAAMLARCGRFEAAEKHYARALELQPKDPDILVEYGRLLNALRRPIDAQERASQALRLQPAHHAAFNVLGNALSEQERYDEAMHAGRRAVALKNDEASYHNDLGRTLVGAGLSEEGERHLRRAIELAPAMEVAWLNLGILNVNRYAFAEATACLEKAISLKPDCMEAHGMLGVSLQFLGRMGEAKAALRRALSLDPRCAHNYNNLGNLYQLQGELSKAARLFEQTLELDASLYEAHSNLLFCHAHDERIGAEQLFREHALFGERFETPLKIHWPYHGNDRNPERALRVGFVSGDLREHAVAYFIEPIFEYFAGSDSIMVHVYSNTDAEDAISDRLRRHVACWRKVTSDTNQQLAERIRSDKIDILIDLSGHTGKYRLLAFAHKPAPVQASWIGYPGTTGLTAVDYYLADRHFLPAKKFDDQFVEKIVHLPSVICFRPQKDAPEVSDVPALANGYMTFASFNRLSKVTESTIAHWSALLRVLPQSRMLIAGMPVEEGYKDPRLIFRDYGVEAERLTLRPRLRMTEYLRLHAEVDLCLDTFGYTGGTTTLHALSMGVPTLTTSGPTAAGRQGAAIMLQMGLAAYVAKDGADFVKRGKRIAGDLDGLARLRRELRSRMRASALGRPEKVAQGLEKALRIMWQRWCAGLPPKSFEVR